MMHAMNSVDLGARLAEILDGGGGEPLSDSERFLPLVTLDSGARWGLDRGARWVILPEDGRPAARYTVAQAYLFHEALEWKRDRFDDAIESAAKEHGLPQEAVLFSF